MRCVLQGMLSAARRCALRAARRTVPPQLLWRSGRAAIRAAVTASIAAARAVGEHHKAVSKQQLARGMATAKTASGGGTNRTRAGLGLTAVPFQLTAAQAREHVVEWQKSGWFGEDLTSRMQRNELVTDAQFLPFYLFRTAIVDVQLKGSARIGRYEYEYNEKTKKEERVMRWTRLSYVSTRFAFGQTVSIHQQRGRVAYDFDTAPGMCVYAGTDFPQHYVHSAMRTTRIAQSLQPFTAELLRTANHLDVEAFAVYPSAAWQTAHDKLRDAEAERAAEWLKQAFPQYDEYDVRRDDVQVVFDTTGAGTDGGVATATRAYVPFYAVEYEHYRYWKQLVVVNGIDGGVGGAWQYSAAKVGGAVVAMHLCSALMAPYLLKLPGFYVQMAALTAAAAVASQFVSQAALAYHRLSARVRERLGLDASTGDADGAEAEWTAREQQQSYQQKQRVRERWQSASAGSAGGSGGAGSSGGSAQSGGAVDAVTAEHYRVLGFTTPQAIAAASLDDIKAAFRREALQNHPDHVPEAQRAAANTRTRRVIEAYQHVRRLKSAK